MPARPASRRSERRASTRAERRAAARRGVVAPRPARRAAPLLLDALWWGTAAVLFAVVARGVLIKITWYLAVDQFGYLTFAHDLLHGRIFHHWPPLDAFAGRVPPRVDILAQTYVAEGGRAYCRYAPGFPLVLAAWIRIFGDDAAHYLNATVFFALLVTLFTLARRLFHSRWRALVVVALVALFPTAIHLWAITPTRDLSAHLAGFLSITLLVPARGRRLAPRRVAAAGVALGYAVTTRPDAVVYAIPVTALFALRWVREGMRWRPVFPAAAAGLLGVLLGLAPLLAYNTMAMGNPFRPTQGMEVERFFDKPAAPVLAPAPPPDDGKVGFPPPGWHGGTNAPVQGGGLRLSNLPSTLPGNFGLLRTAFSDLGLGIAVVGALLALIRRRALFVVTVPYIIVGTVLFSCWSRPDGRYLSGVFCMIPLLVVEGTLGLLDLSRMFVRLRLASMGRGLAVGAAAALAGGLLGFKMPQFAALPAVVWTLAVATVASLLVAAALPGRRVVRVTAPVLAAALTLVALTRAFGRGSGYNEATSSARAGFQRTDMLRARATFARVVEPGSVVITTEDVGRPAENIEYYSGVAWAVYLTDLQRWGVGVLEASVRFALARFHPYLLIPSNQPGRTQMLKDLERAFIVERVATIAPREAMDYFVAAPFHHGIAMELYRLRPHSLTH